MAFVLSRIIADADAALQSTSPESIIISCHAAPIIAVGRVLTGLVRKSLEYSLPPDILTALDAARPNTQRFQHIYVLCFPVQAGFEEASDS